MTDQVFQHESAVVITQLTEMLSVCVQQLNANSQRYQLKCEHSDSSANGISGTAIIQGDTLCSLELLMKPTKSSILNKSAFSEDKQWKLQQIQDAINHLRAARNELASFSAAHMKGTDWFRSKKSYIIDMLTNITKSMNTCKARLTCPCKLSLEALVMSGIVKIFSPPIAGDCIVNFVILEDSLVVTHYTVQQRHTSLSKSSTAVRVPRLFHPVGSLLEHSGTNYEVVTAHRASCVIPWLRQILQSTDACLQLACQLREKLLIF